MQNIDRLLMKARKAAKGIGGCIAIGFVDHDLENGRFTASCSIYGGVNGSESGRSAAGDSLQGNSYNSQQEALSALETMLGGMGIPEENTIIFTKDYGTEV